MLRSSVLLVLNILQLVFTELSVRHDHYVYSLFTPEQFDTDLPQQCIKYYIRLREPVRYVLPHASISIVVLTATWTAFRRFLSPTFFWISKKPTRRESLT